MLQIFLFIILVTMVMYSMEIIDIVAYFNPPHPMEIIDIVAYFWHWLLARIRGHYLHYIGLLNCLVCEYVTHSYIHLHDIFNYV